MCVCVGGTNIRVHYNLSPNSHIFIPRNHGNAAMKLNFYFSVLYPEKGVKACETHRFVGSGEDPTRFTHQRPQWVSPVLALLSQLYQSWSIPLHRPSGISYSSYHFLRELLPYLAPQHPGLAKSTFSSLSTVHLWRPSTFLCVTQGPLWKGSIDWFIFQWSLPLHSTPAGWVMRLSSALFSL